LTVVLAYDMLSKIVAYQEKLDGIQQ